MLPEQAAGQEMIQNRIPDTGTEDAEVEIAAAEGDEKAEESVPEEIIPEESVEEKDSAEDVSEEIKEEASSENFVFTREKVIDGVKVIIKADEGVFPENETSLFTNDRT